MELPLTIPQAIADSQVVVESSTVLQEDAKGSAHAQVVVTSEAIPELLKIVA